MNTEIPKVKNSSETHIVSPLSSKLGETYTLKYVLNDSDSLNVIARNNSQRLKDGEIQWYQCMECHKSFRRRFIMSQHLKAEHGITISDVRAGTDQSEVSEADPVISVRGKPYRRFRCVNCGELPSSVQSLKRYPKKYSKMEHVVCPLCNAIFKKIPSQRMQSSKHPGNANHSQTVEKADNSPSKVIPSHSEDPANKTGKETDAASQASAGQHQAFSEFSEFTRPSDLVVDEQDQRRQKTKKCETDSIMCKVCGRILKDKSEFSKHVHICKKRFKCPCCYSFFIELGILNEHILMAEHFACCCGCCFLSQEYLEDHKKRCQNKSSTMLSLLLL